MKNFMKFLTCLMMAAVFFLLTGKADTVYAGSEVTVVDSSNCWAMNENISWVLTSDGVVTFSGTGPLEPHTSNGAAPNAFRSDGKADLIQTVVIESGITTTGGGIFGNLANLEKIVLSDTVETIDSYSFSYCSNLTTIEIPESVTTIEDRAFWNCTSLKSITIPATVNTIGDDVFKDCSSLVVSVYYGSVAYDYVRENDIDYVVIDGGLLSDAIVTLSKTSYTYDGSAHKPTVTVTYKGSTLKSGTDYNVTYSNNTNAGTASVTIVGDGIYTGTIVKTFTISPKSISSMSVSLSTTLYTYDGKAKQPSVTVKNGSSTLGSSNYSVTYKNNTNAGTATVTVSGKGNYTGTLTAKFTINKAAQTVSVSTTGSSSINAGSATTWKASGSGGGTITYSSGNTSIATVSSSGKVTGKSTGTVKIYATAAATSNYKASSKTLIATIKITLAKPTVSSVANTVNGLKITWDKVTAASGYYVYRKKGSGDYTLLATIKSGSTVTYEDKTAESNKTYTYCVKAYNSSTSSSNSSGKSCIRILPGMVVSLVHKTNGVEVRWKKRPGATGYYLYRKTSTGSYSLVKTITSGTTTTWVDTSSLSSGTTYTYKVIPYCKSSSGSITKAVSQYTLDIYWLSPGKITSLANTSSGIKITWSKVNGADSYTIYRKLGSGTAKSLGSVSGSSNVSITDTSVKNKNGTAYTYYVVPHASLGSKGSANGAYIDKTIVRLTTPTLNKVVSSGTSIGVAWDKMSGVSGYQIVYSTSSDFSSNCTYIKLSGASTVGKIITGLKKGKTYYVKIRTYKTVDGTTYYSAWTDKKKATISK